MYLSAVAHKSMYAENIEALERALHVRMYTVLILNKSLVIFVYIATAVVVLIVLAGGRDHADGIRN